MGREDTQGQLQVANLPDAEEGRPLECVSWEGTTIFSLLRCQPHLVFTPEKHTFKIFYFFTWVVVKYMFALKLFVKLQRHFLWPCLYMYILELKDEKSSPQ